MSIIEWIQDNPLVAAGLAYAVLSAVVAATETKRDDAFLRRFVERFSLLKPRNVFGTLHFPGTAPGPIVEPPTSDEGPRPPGGSAAGLGMVLMLLTSCGGPPSAVQRGVTGAAVMVQQFDVEHATALREAFARIRSEASTLAEARELQQPWERSTSVLVNAKKALLAMQSALDLWEVGAEGGEQAFFAAVTCGAPLIDRLAELATGLGWDGVASVWTPARSLLDPWIRGRCPARDTEVRS